MIDAAYEAKSRIVFSANCSLNELLRQVANPSSEENGISETSVASKGGSSSSNLTTYIGEVEWTATGLSDTYLGKGGAGQQDTRFAVARAISRIHEMHSMDWD